MMPLRFRLLCLAVVVAALGSPLFAVKFEFESDPSQALVRVVGPNESLPKVKVNSITTPGILDLPRSSVPYEIVVSKPNFETVRLTVSTKSDQRKILTKLQPLVVERPLTITVSPADAEVLIDGNPAGVGTQTKTLRFERATSAKPWSVHRVQVRHPEYQGEESAVTIQGPSDSPAVTLTLTRTKHDIPVDLTVVDERDTAIPAAQVLIDGAPVTKTDERGLARITVPFRRDTKDLPWPEFKVGVEIAGEYQLVSRAFAYDAARQQRYVLKPVTEVLVKRNAPSTEMTSRGPRIRLDPTEYVGILNDRDLNSPSTELRAVTNMDRRKSVSTVASFAVTPDGKSIIYSLTSQAEDGKPFSNLYLKSSQSATSPVTQLTRGTRFMDSFPAMSAEDGSTLVVFQSNRGIPDTWDISAVKVEAGRTIGGVQQLTRDSRFNYGPTIGSEQQPVFFVSLDEQPQSVPRISSVRPDGSTFTSYGEVGEMVNYDPRGTLYFSRVDPQTNLLQLYSFAIEGQVFSTVLNDEQFTKSECTWPALSPAADMLLFASNAVLDEQGRKNNNIFLWDIRQGTVLQLTDNGSDDIMPKWSPTEPGVIYFLSNRGGAYNVWRMTFARAR